MPRCLPPPSQVTVYVSSHSGDRRVAKDSRWSSDFLSGKKVPHAIVDLSVHPHLRSRLQLQLQQSLGAAEQPMGTSAQPDDSSLAVLPAIDVGGLRTISKGEMQDLEDHSELDPLLKQAIREFARANSAAQTRQHRAA